MARIRGKEICDLSCGRTPVSTVCSLHLCQRCIDTLRAIAADAGVPIDEGMFSGTLRKKLGVRALTKAERKLEQAIERRELAAAAAAAKRRTA